MDILKQKKNIRLQIKQAKQQLSAVEITAQSENIWTKLEQIPEFKAARNVLCYWSLPFEVETHQFIIRNYKHKTFYLSKVVGRQLTLHKFIGVDSLKRSSYGIMEPEGYTLDNLELIDFAIVPGIAFTINGQRLGRGGGYYDSLLPQLTNALKVGVGFNFQLLKEVACEAHDFIIDKIIIADK